MESSLLQLGNGGHLALMAGLLLVIVALLIFVLRNRQVSEALTDELQRQVGALSRDVDELHGQVNLFSRSGPSSGGLTADQFTLEKAVYQKVWPVIWSLYDKLGIFLRAVESGEDGGETRVAARNAALTARRTFNELRPFLETNIESLLTQFTDAAINAHLAACQYLELQGKGDGGAPDQAAQESARRKFHLLYDGEAKDLLNRIVVKMRQRMLRPSASEPEKSA